MFCHLCHYVNEVTIKLIYYAIFYSHLLYVCTAWVQKLNSKQSTNLSIKTAMCIISFASFDTHILPIFAELNIIKFPDLISLYYFLSKSISLFSHVFSLTSNTGLLKNQIPSCNTLKHDTNAFAAFVIRSREFFQTRFLVTVCKFSYS